MKKNKIAIFVIFAVLVLSLFVLGCSSGGGKDNTNPDDTNPDDTNPVVTANARGKVLILQAYGNGPTGGDNPAGVSRSFVELYNKSDEVVDLTGISLYFADGIRAENVSEDEVWKSIPLNGTIPAKGSYLILGKKHDHGDTTARYVIQDSEGDIVDNSMILSRRAFKIAIIKSTAELTVQNPFDTDGNGTKASGYIDMVGALNNANATPPDNIFGYETAPTRCSASEGFRRKDLTDTDNNLNDFISARYAISGEGAYTDEMLEVRKPRNSSAGAWDPFAPPVYPPPPDTDDVDYSKLKLNEVSGVGTDSAKFYELKNTGDVDIPLFDCKIYYSANGSTGGTLPAVKGNPTWTGSTSQTISAGGLFSLIGRNTVGSFTTGLTAERILVITLEDPEGNVIDKCIRAADTGDYAFTDKSFSRIPDGTGDFYFATPTSNATNGTSTVGLTKLPNDPPIITGFGRDKSSVTPSDTVTISATVKTTASTATISTVVIQWTLGGAAQTVLNMTASGNVYSATIPAQELNSVVTYKVLATNSLSETNSSATQDYTVLATSIDFSKLILNEVSGNNKYVEIYNSGAVAIPLEGVKLQRNNGTSAGGSEWVGTASDSIPAGAYRLFLFNSYTPSTLNTNPAYTGWAVSSGISSGQILKVAIVDPSGTAVSVFIRGDAPLPAWQTTTNVTQDSTNTYSRMSDGTWAYAASTPGAANGTKVADIVSPGYLTAQP